MKNLFIIIFTTIFLTSCESLNNFSKEIFPQAKQEEAPKPIAAKPIEQPRNLTPFLYSRNLDTLKANKKKVKVGLFFPFSGKNRDLGWSLYNAAVISLFDNDINHNIELVLIDSKDTPSEPAKSIKEIIDHDIKVVVGPVFSSSVESLGKDFIDNSITAISLSNNQQLSGKINNGGGVFIAGFLPEQQIDKVVSYAMDHNKINFAVLAPNNQYGLTVANMFKRIVKTRDGTIITSEFYDSSGNDLNKVIERLVNASMVPARLAEGGGNKLAKNTIIKDSDRTYPQVIFIPESGKTLTKITDLIKQYNTQEHEYQIIGTAQWDDVSTLNSGNLFGAWFAAPEHHRFASFEKSYYQTYNKFPPRIASIAYDSVAAIAELIDKKEGLPANADFINYFNPQKNGFSGIDGGFRFLANGLVQRNLAVLQVGSGEFITIDRPADKFLKY